MSTPPPPVLDKDGIVFPPPQGPPSPSGKRTQVSPRATRFPYLATQRWSLPRRGPRNSLSVLVAQRYPHAPTSHWQMAEKQALTATHRNPGTIWLLFPSLSFPSDTWKGTESLVEARGQGPASPGRPLPPPAQPLLPFAPAPLPRSQRWAGGHWMTPAEPGPDSPSPPPRAGLPQPSPRREAARAKMLPVLRA